MPETEGAQPCAALLHRARQLLGEDGGSGNGDAAELAHCLRRLYRAQNRLDPAGLRQLGGDCLQALEEGTLAGGVQLQAAAAALARLRQT